MTRQPGMAAPVASDRFVACLQLVSIAEWTAQHGTVRNRLLVLNLIAYPKYRDVSFFNLDKGIGGYDSSCIVCTIKSISDGCHSQRRGIGPLAASGRRARDWDGRRHLAAPKRLPVVRRQVGASPVTSNAMMVTASSADVQVVAAASRILVDVQAWHFDTAGQSRRDYACVGLSVSEARRLCVLLGRAIAIAAEAEPRQGRIQLALALSCLQKRDLSRPAAGNLAQPGAGTPGQACQARE